MRSPVVIPRWRAQGLAIFMAMGISFGLGQGLLIVGVGLNQINGTAGAWPMILGGVLAFSVMFSWLGHLAGTLVLRGLLSRGLGGWLVVALGGLAVGLVLAQWLGALAAIVGPVLAVIQLASLRFLMAGASTRRAG